MGDEVNKELKYSQEDMDNITAKVKESTISKFEKTHISKETYDELLAKYNELNGATMKSNFKDKFISFGGVEGCFEDFYKLEKDNIANLKEKDYDKYFENVSNTKQWAFGSKQSSMLDDKKIMNDLMKDNIDLVEGTIYKKNF